MNPVPEEVDVLVLGSGAGGMTAALTAAVGGLDVLLVEKAAVVGGTTARSAGSVWIPGSRHAPASDSPDDALTYLRNALGNRLREPMIMAFLRAGPEMVAFLEDHTPVAFRPYAHHPDYLATLEGATLSGRALEPVPFDAAVLGTRFSDLSRPLPEFMLFGGMMVDRTDIGHLLNVGKSLASMRHVARLVGRYAADRLRFGRGARLVMGSALVGRLYHALLRRDVSILTSTTVSRLTAEDGHITGAVLTSRHGTHDVHCRRAVILATGGFSRNPALRRQLMPAALSPHSPVAETATGDGIALAQAAGGYLGDQHANAGFWSPVSLHPRRDGSQAVFPHLVLDRGKPGLIAVTPDAVRFVNEAVSYHLFTEAMLTELRERPTQPCFLICDHDFILRYGLGMVQPRGFNLRRLVAEGYVAKADSLAALASGLGLPAAALAATVDRHNGFAATGIDEDFHKGSDAYQRNLGDPAHGPNPCIGVLARAPFYGVRIYAGDIGTSRGLVTNEFAQIVRRDGTCIAGLYACGNDMDSIMAGIYPGPGITLGPAMTFGFIAARHAAGS
jgi:succinate dehydrogenase/fumarate reductase flavoprotein subunit